MRLAARRTKHIFYLIIALTVIAGALVGCGQDITTASERSGNPTEKPIELDQEELVRKPAQAINSVQSEIAPGVGDRAAADEHVSQADNQIVRETRAVWSWAGRKKMPGRDKISKRDIDELVAKVDAAHLNVILLMVYHQGTVYFEPSQARFPDSRERLTNQSAFAETEDGYPDALSYLLAIRDQRRADHNPFNDFEVHAWFGVHQGGDREQGWPPVNKTETYMLNALFPEFKLKYGTYYLKEDERYVYHAVSVVHQPKFRAYMTNLVAGLVEDYDVDGIHLDYIRTGGICFNNEFLDYPGTEYDYPGCQEDYKAWTRATYGREYTLWEDTDGLKEIRDGGTGRVAAWQERGVGLLVKSIHDEVKAVRPEVIISAAVGMTSPEDRKESIQGQPAWEWFDQGWIDIPFVMAYNADTQAVINKLQSFMDASAGESDRSKIFPGLITYDIDGTEAPWSDPITTQINATLYGQWTGQILEPRPKGVALYLDRRLSEEAIQALAEGPFKKPALPFWGK